MAEDKEEKAIANFNAQNQITIVPKLNGRNFRSWLTIINANLEYKKLDEALRNEGDAEKDLKCKIFLYSALDDQHVERVSSCTTSKQIMERLKAIYADDSAVNAERVLMKFFNFKYKPGDDMSNHIAKLEGLRTELSNLRQPQSEEVFMAKMLNSLPTEYNALRENWEFAHRDVKTYNNLVGHILKTEEKLKNLERESAALIATKSTSSMDIEERKKVTRCAKCGYRGHWARECKTLPENYLSKRTNNYGEGSNKREAKRNINLVFGINDESLKDKWLLDSGATEHMCNNKEYFETYHQYDKPQYCMVGDGNHAAVEGFGSIILETTVEGNKFEFNLEKVALVPSLPTNLISMGMVDEKGISIVCAQGKCELKLDGITIAKGRRSSLNLYDMNLRACGPKFITRKALLCPKTLDDWHKTMGHPGEDRLRKLLKDPALGVKVEDKPIDCRVCPEGKAVRATHPSIANKDRQKGVVHVDLSGRVNIKSLDNMSYYLLAKDEESEYCFSYLLEDKGNSSKAIAKMLVDYELYSGEVIREFHCDCGSEFLNQQNETLLLKEHIGIVTSAPYTPQQNGLIEREMRTITSMARTMLLDSRLPENLWGEAIQTAAFLKNRTPTKRADTTPYERFTKRKPTIKHLVPFGSECQVIINWNYLAKFDSRTERGFVVGFTNRRNTYRVFLPSKQRVIETSDVIWSKHRAEPERLTDHHRMNNTREPPTEEVVFFSSEYDRDQNGGNANKTLLDEYFDNLKFDESNNNEEARPSTPENACNLTEDDLTLSRGIRRCEVHSPTQEELDLRREKAMRTPERPIYSVQPSAPTLDESIAARVKERDDRIANRKLFLVGECLVIDGKLPGNYEEAISGLNSTEWRRAIAEELKAHDEAGTWTIVQKPSTELLLSARWVFNVKRDDLGQIERYKARLVARGYKQREGIDYYQTYSPVAGNESIRTMLAICVAKRLQMLQFDVKCAFLHGDLEEEVFIEPPSGLKVEDNQCLKLNKALYGLKQSPRCWHTKLTQVLGTMHFKATVSEPCLFVNDTKDSFITIYVDDGIVFAPTKQQCHQIIDNLDKHFQTKVVMSGCFLGMRISQDMKGIHISQERYITDILTRFKMLDATSVDTPLADAKSLFEKDEGEPPSFPYREAIGSLLYAATHTRPDILFATSLLARFTSRYHNIHVNAVRRIMRYLSGTRNARLRFPFVDDNFRIEGFSDSDWAGDINDSKSTSGLLILLNNCPIIFQSKKQSICALSSTEAEYIAACEAARQMHWLIELLKELNINPGQPTLYLDNSSTIRQIENHQINSRSRHVRLKFHYIKSLYNDKVFKLRYVPTEKQLADFLTKQLSSKKLQDLLNDRHFFSSEDNLRRMNPSNHKKMALLMIIMMAAYSPRMEASVKLQRADYNIWHRTDLLVDEGILQIEIQYVPQSACKVLFNDDEKKNNLSRSAHEKVKEECDNTFQQKVKPQLEALGTCFPPNVEEEVESLFARIKRAIFAIGLIATLTLTIAALIGLAVPVTQLNTQLKTMDNQTGIIIHNVEHLKHGFNETVTINDNANRIMEILSARSKQNEDDIKFLAGLIPDIAYKSSSVYFNQMTTARALKNIVADCKKGKLNLAGLSEITGIEGLEEFDERDLKLVEVGTRTIDDQEAYVFLIQATKRAKDTFIYRIESFERYFNMTTNPTVAAYTGPVFAVYNQTSNCTMGVEVDTRSMKWVNPTLCDKQNYRDEALDQWEAKTTQPKGYKDPQVISTKLSKVLYCPYFKFVYEGEELPCVNYPMVLPLNITWRTKGYAHTAENKVWKSSVIYEPIQVETREPLEIDQVTSDLMDLMIKIKESNDKAKEIMSQTKSDYDDLTGFLSALRKYFSLNLESWVPSWFSFSWLEILSFLSILWTVYGCAASYRNGGQNRDEINIINNPPEVVEPLVHHGSTSEETIEVDTFVDRNGLTHGAICSCADQGSP